MPALRRTCGLDAASADGRTYRYSVPTKATLSFDPIAEAHRQWVDHDWAPSADGMALITSVIRVQQVFLAQVEGVLRPLGLTFARYELLMLLLFTRTGMLPLGKIGARLQVHAASITNAVDRLEADALVERQPHPSDGRATLARITPLGKTAARRATTQLNEQVFSKLSLSATEQRSLFSSLQTVRSRAGDFTVPLDKRRQA